MPSKKKKASAIALAVAVPLAVPLTAPAAEAENSSKEIYSPKPRPYIPSRHEMRHSHLVNNRAKKSTQGLNSMEVHHERDCSKSTSAVRRSPSRGRCLQRENPTIRSPLPRPEAAEFHPLLLPLCDVATLPSPDKASQSSSSDHKIPTPPSPLLDLQSFPAYNEPPLSPPCNHTDLNPPSPPLCDALLFLSNAKASWWAAKSDSLAALSMRAYHLSCASVFLTCKIEELTLLKEVRNMNLDGIELYSEIVIYLRENLYEITDRRIMWDMEAKLHDAIRYDQFVRESVGNCEWEINQQVNEKGCDEDWETELGWEKKYSDCDVEDSSTEGTPIHTPVASTIDSPIEASHDNNSTNSSSEETHVDTSDDSPVKDAHDDEPAGPPVTSHVNEILVDTSVPTWAQVAAGKMLKFHGSDWAETLGRTLGESWGAAPMSPTKDFVHAPTNNATKSSTNDSETAVSSTKDSATSTSLTKGSSPGSSRSCSPEKRWGPSEWGPRKNWVPAKSPTRGGSMDLSGRSWRQD